LRENRVPCGRRRCGNFCGFHYAGYSHVDFGGFGRPESVALVVLQVTPFQVFETAPAKFNKVVTIPAASPANKGFPQTADLSQGRRVQARPAKPAQIPSDFLD
jgi:hypothetical protein